MNFTITKHTVRRGFAAVSASLESRVKNVPSAMLLLVSVVYLVPLSGVLGSETVALLYGPRFGREIVFLVAFLIFCSVTPSWRSAAYTGTFLYGVSALFRFGLSALSTNASVAEVFALVCLVIGGIALLLERRSRGEQRGEVVRGNRV